MLKLGLGCLAAAFLFALSFVAGIGALVGFLIGLIAHATTIMGMSPWLFGVVGIYSLLLGSIILTALVNFALLTTAVGALLSWAGVGNKKEA